MFKYSIAILAMLLIASNTSRAQTFDLAWHTFDGGGLTFGSGGLFELGSTLGQADAGPMMTGGSWALAGGFWAGTSQPSTTPCPGDLNGDRNIDLSDLAALLGHFGMMSGASLANGDTDGDGDVDLSDLSLLLANFGATCP